MQAKLDRLKALIKSYKSLAVGFSGGIDSTLLCYISFKELNNSFIAVITTSESFPESELSLAISIAEKYNWPYKVITTKELNDQQFISNDINRCSICKEIKFNEIKAYAEKNGYKFIASGDNSDDLNDYRPGLRKIQSLNVETPLITANFTKQEITALAKELDLPNYNKPSTPCLASRIPYGTKITPESLSLINNAEKFIESLGYTRVRVRHYGHLAKIEVDKDKIINLISFHSNLINDHLQQLGYKQVSIDLQGYRTGSLNEGLTK